MMVNPAGKIPYKIYILYYQGAESTLHKTTISLQEAKLKWPGYY